MTIRPAVAHLDQIGSVDPAWAPAWRSIRHHFGIASFGVNAAVDDPPGWLVVGHTEADTGDEELYVVLRGTARFTVDEAVFDAPAGTLVVPEIEAFRAAQALAPGTVLLFAGGRPGARYVAPDWDGGGAPDPDKSGYRRRPGRTDGYRCLDVRGAPSDPVHLGMRSLRVDVLAAGTGEVAIDATTLTGGGTLYAVAEGGVRMTVGAETIDAPPLTFVHVPAGLPVSAVATAPGTLVYALDGEA
jgi:hypothetical protein